MNMEFRMERAKSCLLYTSRLAARLTGYKIDIKSESQAAEEAAKVSEEPEADEFEIEEDLFNEEDVYKRQVLSLLMF